MTQPGLSYFIAWASVTFLLLGQSLAGESTATTTKPSEGVEVEIKRDIGYNGENDTDPKHKLDLYLPKGHKDFPVLFFVHGGAWKHGDKQHWLGIYGNIGRTFARKGIGTVVINYRLSPQVQHPAHIQDVAKAFAWTYRNIGQYGGRPDQIFICGHSAGGHLVALLATNASYLKAENLSITNIKGVIAISGVYNLPTNGQLFTKVFGDDEETRRKASPLHHVNGKHPPFLILYAESDFPTCDKMSEEFCKRLQEHQCAARTLKIEDRNHVTIILSLGIENQPVTEAVLAFIAEHTSGKSPAQGKQTADKDK